MKQFPAHLEYFALRLYIYCSYTRKISDSYFLSGIDKMSYAMTYIPMAYPTDDLKAKSRLATSLFIMLYLLISNSRIASSAYFTYKDQIYKNICTCEEEIHKYFTSYTLLELLYVTKLVYNTVNMDKVSVEQTLEILLKEFKDRFSDDTTFRLLSAVENVRNQLRN